MSDRLVQGAGKSRDGERRRNVVQGHQDDEKGKNAKISKDL